LAEVETFVDVTLMYATVAGLLLFALIVILPRLKLG
jgi:hypothetical protein